MSERIQMIVAPERLNQVKNMLGSVWERTKRWHNLG